MSDMDEYQDIKELLKPRRTIGASAQLRQRIGDASAHMRKAAGNTRWWTAAACVALIVGATMFFAITPAADNSDCIVYVAGQKASSDQAHAIAEADVARMEQFMHTVARQNAAEQEKVNQFMQHKSLQK